MPKEGYGAVTVPVSLKEQLTITAKDIGLSVPRLIESLLAGYSTYSTNGGNIVQQKNLIQAPFPKNNSNFKLGLPAFPASRGRRPH